MIANIEKDYGSFSKDTELLTPYGWLNITKVTYWTRVAQYHLDGTITFTIPKMLGRVYVEKAIRLFNKQCHFDQLIGRGQVVPYVAIPEPKVNVKIVRAKIDSVEKTPHHSHVRYLHTGIYNNYSSKILTFGERLKIAFQADGYLDYRGKQHDRIKFEFSKTHKIHRFEWLLREAGIECRPAQYETNMVYYRFRSPVGCYEKEFNWIDLSTVSLQWCRDFIEEVSHWDASILDKEYLYRRYYNTRKHAIDQVQAIATLAGYKTHVGTEIFENTNQKTKYTLSVNGGTKCITGDKNIKQFIDYNTYMYQVMTASGFLVIRRNNAVSISGCGFYNLEKSTTVREHCIDLI